MTREEKKQQKRLHARETLLRKADKAESGDKLVTLGAVLYFLAKRDDIEVVERTYFDTWCQSELTVYDYFKK